MPLTTGAAGLRRGHRDSPPQAVKRGNGGPNKKGLLAQPHERKAYSLVYLPVPDRLEVCGAPAALSLARNNPVLVPIWVGLNITLIVQLDWAERVLGQFVPVTLKSPVVPIKILASGTFCLLLSVNVFAELPFPTFVPGKVALVGVRVTVPEEPVPVPDNGTCCGLFEASSVIVMSPVRSPVCVGVNVALIKQFAPTANVLPQGFVEVTRAKSPLIWMLLICSVPVPEFLRVTVLAALVLPNLTLPKASEVGVRVTAPPPPLPFTVRLNVVD